MKYSKPLEPYVIYLNTEQNCLIKYDNGVRNTEVSADNTVKTNATSVYEYTWEISPIVLTEYATIKLISIAHDTDTHSSEHGDKVIQFRLKDILYNPELYRGTDRSNYPVLFACAWTDNEMGYWDGNVGGISIVPQTIRRITMVVSGDLTNNFAGVDKKLQFIIGLNIQPYDRLISDYET